MWGTGETGGDHRALLISQLRVMGFGPDTATLDAALRQGGGDLPRAIAHLLDHLAPDNPGATVAAAAPGPSVYRFVPTRTRSPGAGEVQLQQVRFLDAHGSGVAPVAVANPGGNCPAGEGPANAGRGDRSKWLDFRKQPLEFTLPSLPPVATVALVTANDFPERDPVGWRIEMAAPGGGGWTILYDTATAHPPPPAVPTRRHTPTSPVRLAVPPSPAAATSAAAAARPPPPRGGWEMIRFSVCGN